MTSRSWRSANEALRTEIVENSRPDGDEDVITPTWTKYMPAWHAEAACRGVEGADEVFFGENEETRASMNLDRQQRAQQICYECPVIRVCALHALTEPEDYGVWAGTTTKMRERARDLVTAGLMTIETVIDIIEEGNAHAFKKLQDSLTTGLKDVI